MVLIFLILTISTAIIGLFAIDRYRSSEITRIDKSLQEKVHTLINTKQDPLSVAEYLAQISAIPLTAAYISGTHNLVPLTTGTAEGSVNFEGEPSKSEIQKALTRPVELANHLRLRTVKLPKNEYLLLAESDNGIHQAVISWGQQLAGFIILIDLLALFIAYLVFKKMIELTN